MRWVTLAIAVTALLLATLDLFGLRRVVYIVDLHTDTLDPMIRAIEDHRERINEHSEVLNGLGVGNAEYCEPREQGV